MKLYKYISIVSFFMLVGCSDDEDGASKNQTVEQTNTVTKKTESKGALSGYVKSIEMAKQAKALQEESDKKKKELEQGM